MYAWKITEYNKDLFDDSNLVSGPANITYKLQLELDADHGTEFKMYDDDGEWYYTGLIVGEFDKREPLDDFGLPNAGCTEIRYKNDEGKWEAV